MVEYYPTNIGVFFQNSDKIVSVNGVPYADIEPAPNSMLLLRGHDEITSFEVEQHTGYHYVAKVKEDFRLAAIALGLQEEYIGINISYGDDDNFVTTEGPKQYLNFYSVSSVADPAEIVEMEVSKQPFYFVENYPEQNQHSNDSMRITASNGTQVDINNAAFAHEVLTLLSAATTQEDLLYLLTPPFARYTLPVSVDSRSAYRIIRNFVKRNIDPKCAAITSDYDFCFDVSKLVQHNPITRKHEVLNNQSKSYRPPRFREVVTTAEKVKVFEMTHAGEKYKGYTVHPGFKSDNLQDLVNNVTRYLTELIEAINSKTERCECCDGKGVVITSFKF